MTRKHSHSFSFTHTHTLSLGMRNNKKKKIITLELKLHTTIFLLASSSVLFIYMYLHSFAKSVRPRKFIVDIIYGDIEMSCVNKIPIENSFVYLLLLFRSFLFWLWVRWDWERESEWLKRVKSFGPAIKRIRRIHSHIHTLTGYGCGVYLFFQQHKKNQSNRTMKNRNARNELNQIHTDVCSRFEFRENSHSIYHSQDNNKNK